MFDWNKWLKIIFIIPITILFNFNVFLSKPSDIMVGDLLLGKIMGQMTTDNATVFIFLVDSLFYLIIFNLLYGNFIYDDFRYSSVYLFSRLKSRKTWFYKKSLELLGITIVYTLIFLLTNLWLSKMNTVQAINSETLIIFGLLFTRLVLLLFLTTILINLLSIRFGNALGFITVYIGVVMLIFLAASHQSIPFIGSNNVFLFLNPICGLIEETFSNFNIQVLFYFYNFFLLCIINIVGAFYIDRFDIALVDYENE